MNVHPKFDVDQAAEMWADGASIGEIAAHFGTSRGKVSGAMHRDRERFPAKTNGQMAKNRAGGNGSGSPKVSFGAAPKPPKSEREQKPRTYANTRTVHKVRQEAARREAEEFKAGTSPLLQIAPSDQERLDMGRSKELIDLEPNDCRWVLNNGGPFLFCADNTFGETYCRHHSIRAHWPRMAEAV